MVSSTENLTKHHPLLRHAWPDLAFPCSTFVPRRLLCILAVLVQLFSWTPLVSRLRVASNAEHDVSLTCNPAAAPIVSNTYSI